MLVDHQVQPFRVKLIDFGLVVKTPKSGKDLAPEVILGQPFNAAIDLRFIIDLLGEPPRKLLNSGLFTESFFKGKANSLCWDWKFKIMSIKSNTIFCLLPDTLGVSLETKLKTSDDREYTFSSLEELKTSSTHNKTSFQAEDRKACVELLQDMLQMDQKKRITPKQILAHPFITRSYLNLSKNCLYGTETVEADSSSERPETEQTKVDGTQTVQGDTPSSGKAEIAHEIKLDSITDEDWEISIVSVIGKGHSEAPKSSSEESLPAPVVSEPRKKKKKGIRGFFSRMRRNFFSCFFMPSVLKSQPLVNTISDNYKILIVLGAGSFGQVLKCLKLDTAETVAVKVLRNSNADELNMREMLMLEKLRCMDSDKSNIVRCHECFQRSDRTFMVFEMLDMSLMNLKLDNVMLVDHQVQPFRVKLIDFGLVVKTSEVRKGLVVQPVWHRAPEVILGQPFNEAIDVWSLGTILAVMLLGFPLFPGNHQYDVTPLEFQLETKLKTSDDREYTFSSLEELKTSSTHNKTSFQAEDRKACVELLQDMLQMDQKKRITPKQILAHPFITRSYLNLSKNCLYGTETVEADSSSERPETEQTKLPVGVIEVQTDERTVLVEEATKESSVIRTQTVQGDTPSSGKAEIAHEIKLDSITDEDWEISIVSVIGKGHSEAPKSSSEESLPAPVVSEPRKKKKKGIRGFFSRMRRNFFSCFCVPGQGEE
ncbi:hypothetical protein F7725_000991 [Dissostichus mawsoni]|uniref:Protein kinase domain-containing protein n=1 Tax=Dissostichus mawsoni TaxID=36200 RepID=A0A7J5ZGG7_DISMA|nr:hypothetical protein F7725_000991 [Dissostichus mawsoni]